LAMEDWLLPDDAFDAQMGERDRLLDTVRDDVLMLEEGAMAAAQELLRMVLAQLYGGASTQVTRPCGTSVVIDWEDPLGSLGRITQQDFCLLQKRGDEHVMTGAVLCFPASWKLSEKISKPLIDIHEPIDSYDTGIAARVQRLFDGVQPGRPLWRFNALWYQDSALHQPRSRHQRRASVDPERGGYFRSERQMILRLPESKAVVFCIHTFVVRRADLIVQWGSLNSK